MSKALLPSLLLVVSGYGLTALANEATTTQVEEKYVIALKTDDFELAETDVSNLAVGESETIVTEDGKTIDILRTDEGLELYVDGVLQEMNFNHDLHGEHPGLHKEIEIICTDEDDCEEMVWISEDEDIEFAGSDEKVIKREITVECADDGECADKNIWITENGETVHIDDAEGDLHVIRLHEGHEAQMEDGGNKKVIVIKREADSN